MVSDATLSHDTLPVYNGSVVSKCKNTSVGYLFREEGLRPGFGLAGGRPGLFTVTVESMDEDNTG